MQNLFLADRNEMKAAFKEALQEHQKEIDERPESDTLYSINGVARRLGRSHATIKKLVKNGLLKTTRDGQIPLSSINEYLKRK